MRPSLSDALLAEGLAPDTVYQYVKAVDRAKAWFAGRGSSLDTATATELSEFVQTLPHTWSSRNLARASITWYWSVTERPSPPVKALRVPKRPEMVCKALEDEESAMLAKAARHRGDAKGLAVAIGLYTAFRRAEIAKLRWGDFADGWVHLIGKREKEARLPVHPVLAELLDHQAPTPRQGWLFPGRFGGHVCPTTIWTWTLEVAREAGVGHVPTHVLRHIALATANDRTGDLRATQKFARHTDPAVTAGYTRASVRRLKAVVESLDY